MIGGYNYRGSPIRQQYSKKLRKQGMGKGKKNKTRRSKRSKRSRQTKKR